MDGLSWKIRPEIQGDQEEKPKGKKATQKMMVARCGRLGNDEIFIHESKRAAERKGRKHLKNWKEVVRDVIPQTPIDPAQIEEGRRSWEEIKNFWKKREPETTETAEQKKRREWQNIKMYILTQKLEALPIMETGQQNNNKAREHIMNIIMNEEPEYELLECEKRGNFWQAKSRKEDIVLAGLERLDKHTEDEMCKVDHLPARAGETSEWRKDRTERTMKEQRGRRGVQIKENNMKTDWIAKEEDKEKEQMEQFEEIFNKVKGERRKIETNADLKENQKGWTTKRGKPENFGENGTKEKK